MKSRMQTGLLAIFLLLALSCTKETTNSDANSKPGNAMQSADAFAQFLGSQHDLQIAGKWELYYDWGRTGYYSSSVMVVNNDGTWRNDQGFTGLWIKGQHVFLFTFNNSETTYSGIVCNKEIKGIMSTFLYVGSLQGCFYMQPYDNNFKSEQISGSFNSDGKQQ